MKILTLNTHSLVEENSDKKLHWFVEGILREKPDIIALQEVNQTADEGWIDPEMLAGQYPVPGCMKIRRDNFAARCAHLLREAGLECFWAWVPVKLGYGKYDEGVAVLSIGRKIRCVDQFPVSRTNDYQNWRTRAVLGVQVEGLEDWFYTVHMGWWNDEAERFLDQWKKLNTCVTSKRMCAPVWLLGDFNGCDRVRDESYDLVSGSGWLDTYFLAKTKDAGITVPEAIDSVNRETAQSLRGSRLDYIWCSKPVKIRSSRTMFTGTREPVVSDHFGVLIETDDCAGESNS